MNRNESGQGLVEYALLIVLVAIIPIAQTLYPDWLRELGRAVGDVYRGPEPCFTSPCNDYITTSMNTSIIFDVSRNDYNPYTNPRPGSISVRISDDPQYGSVNDLGDGWIEYTPPNFFFGLDSFEYEICGTECTEWDNAAVFIEVELDEAPDPITASAAKSSPTGLVEQFKDVMEQATRQIESIQETVTLLQEVADETLEIWLEHFSEDGIEVPALTYLQQEIQDGNYVNVVTLMLDPDLDYASELTSEIAQLSEAVQVDVLLKTTPLYIDACLSLNGAQLSPDTFSSMRQLWTQAEEVNPGSTRDIILRLDQIWQLVELGNTFIEETQPALITITNLNITLLKGTNIEEYITFAEQYEVEIANCGSQ